MTEVELAIAMSKAMPKDTRLFEIQRTELKCPGRQLTDWEVQRPTGGKKEVFRGEEVLMDAEGAEEAEAVLGKKREEPPFAMTGR